MMKTLLVTILCCCAVHAVAQIPAKREDNFRRNLVPAQPKSEVRQEGVEEAFGEIEARIAKGDIQSLLVYLGSQVYMDMSSGDHGYFSSNQSLSLLESYFSQHKPVSFKFVTVNQRAPSPFATGKLEFISKGSKESAHIYIALTRRDTAWKMTQFTVY